VLFICDQEIALKRFEYMERMKEERLRKTCIALLTKRNKKKRKKEKNAKNRTKL
jgi:hypothetical protein